MADVLTTIVLLTFVTTIALVVGIYFLVLARRDTRLRSQLLRRIDRSGPSLDRGPAGELQKTQTPLSDVPALDAMLRRSTAVSGPLERLVAESGLHITVGALVLSSLLAASLGYLIVRHFVLFTYAAVIAAPLTGAIPFAVVRVMRTRRLDRFEEQFPESIELMARALRAGHAFTTALLMAAEEIPEPAGAEFKLVHDQQNFGLPVPDALKGLAQRVPILDVRMFVTAVLTQRESGGNLSEVLDNLASVIRDRFRVKRQVRVLTAHGRITGWVLVGVPPSLAAVLSVTSPNHLKMLVSDPLGMQMVTVAVLLQLAGTLLIRKLVNVPY